MPGTDICKYCYLNTRNIYCITKVLSTEHTKVLVNVSKKLQNCTDRLIEGGCKYHHMTPLAVPKSIRELGRVSKF